MEELQAYLKKRIDESVADFHLYHMNNEEIMEALLFACMDLSDTYEWNVTAKITIDNQLVITPDRSRK